MRRYRTPRNIWSLNFDWSRVLPHDLFFSRLFLLFGLLAEWVLPKWPLRVQDEKITGERVLQYLEAIFIAKDERETSPNVGKIVFVSVISLFGIGFDIKWSEIGRSGDSEDERRLKGGSLSCNYTLGMFMSFKSDKIFTRLPNNKCLKER